MDIVDIILDKMGNEFNYGTENLDNKINVVSQEMSEQEQMEKFIQKNETKDLAYVPSIIIKNSEIQLDQKIKIKTDLISKGVNGFKLLIVNKDKKKIYEEEIKNDEIEIDIHKNQQILNEYNSNPTGFNLSVLILSPNGSFCVENKANDPEVLFKSIKINPFDIDKIKLELDPKGLDNSKEFEKWDEFKNIQFNALVRNLPVDSNLKIKYKFDLIAYGLDSSDNPIKLGTDDLQKLGIVENFKREGILDANNFMKKNNLINIKIQNHKNIVDNNIHKFISNITAELCIHRENEKDIKIIEVKSSKTFKKQIKKEIKEITKIEDEAIKETIEFMKLCVELKKETEEMINTTISLSNVLKNENTKSYPAEKQIKVLLEKLKKFKSELNTDKFKNPKHIAIVKKDIEKLKNEELLKKFDKNLKIIETYLNFDEDLYKKLFNFIEKLLIIFDKIIEEGLTIKNHKEKKKKLLELIKEEGELFKQISNENENPLNLFIGKLNLLIQKSNELLNLLKELREKTGRYVGHIFVSEKKPPESFNDVPYKNSVETVEEFMVQFKKSFIPYLKNVEEKLKPQLKVAKEKTLQAMKWVNEKYKDNASKTDKPDTKENNKPIIDSINDEKNPIIKIKNNENLTKMIVKGNLLNNFKLCGIYNEKNELLFFNNLNVGVFMFNKNKSENFRWIISNHDKNTEGGFYLSNEFLKQEVRFKGKLYLFIETEYGKSAPFKFQFKFDETKEEVVDNEKEETVYFKFPMATIHTFPEPIKNKTGSFVLKAKIKGDDGVIKNEEFLNGIDMDLLLDPNQRTFLTYFNFHIKDSNPNFVELTNLREIKIKKENLTFGNKFWKLKERIDINLIHKNPEIFYLNHNLNFNDKKDKPSFDYPFKIIKNYPFKGRYIFEIHPLENKEENLRLIKFFIEQKDKFKNLIYFRSDSFNLDPGEIDHFSFEQYGYISLFEGKLDVYKPRIRFFSSTKLKSNSVLDTKEKVFEAWSNELAGTNENEKTKINSFNGTYKTILEKKFNFSFSQHTENYGKISDSFKKKYQENYHLVKIGWYTYMDNEFKIIISKNDDGFVTYIYGSDAPTK